MTSQNYFDRPEVSNSDLSWLKLQHTTPEFIRDYTDAYRMGNLIDAMITDTWRVDYYQRTLLNEATGELQHYTLDEFDQCEKMKQAFGRDEFCRRFLLLCSGQVVKTRRIGLIHGGMVFGLNFRVKYDLWSDHVWWGGDIKSTTATTQKQFLESIDYFDYDRQRVAYMRTARAKQDMIIGISKVNFKIFKVPIRTGDQLYERGYRKLAELGFKWWYLFDGFNPTT